MIQTYEKGQFAAMVAEENFDPAAVIAEDASAHITLKRGGKIAARCSVWWEDTPTHADGPCGTIGQFQTLDSVAATELLESACALLEQRGCTYVLAPMHGNTYRSYRYATGGMDRSPFLMEPPAADGRDRLLEQCGFQPVDQYHSYVEQLQERGVSQQRKLLEGHGIRIEPLNPEHLEQTLKTIYGLSCVCFRDNPHYTDIDERGFMEQYLPYRHLLVPEFILLAYERSACIGFVFGIPDYLETARGVPATVLLKTIAVLPQYRKLGVGAALVDTVRQAAWKRGFKEAIVALVYEGNVSRHLLQERTILRQYTLYGKML